MDAQRFAMAESGMTSGVGLRSEGWALTRAEKWALLAVSVVILVPCLWHRHIEAGDLGSHVYNAWLAQLIEKGQAPGLYFVRQWDNVLVDWMLLHAANVAGFAAAEKIVVSLCVLIFFWGVFTLVGAAANRPPWVLAPCMAMLAYGYTFNMGFLNYYLSLGLASFSLALLWEGKGIGRWIGAGLVPLVLLAHPLGLLWLAGTGLYIALWTKLPGWWKLAVPLLAVAGLAAVHWYLTHRVAYPINWRESPFYIFNGADQLVLYNTRYRMLAALALAVGVVCAGMEAFSRRHDPEFWRSLRLPLELYGVAIFATAVLPQDLRLSPTGGLIGLLVSRLTTITAIFGLCVINQLKPTKLQLAGFGACAVAFFALLYQDTSVLNRMEANVESMVSGMPFGTKVLSTIWAPPNSHISFVGHFVDRACIGRCFSYANYEPSTEQFRIRARTGSPVVTASYDDSGDMQAGEYEVQGEDLPMKEIFQCDEKDLTKLCIRDLTAGEQNGRLGYKPPTD